jgi:hypothetical protein
MSGKIGELVKQVKHDSLAITRKVAEFWSNIRRQSGGTAEKQSQFSRGDKQMGCNNMVEPFNLNKRREEKRKREELRRGVDKPNGGEKEKIESEAARKQKKPLEKFSALVPWSLICKPT